MRPYEKHREPASMALIEMRTLLGMSQAEFAVKLLGTAPMTVSRWETMSPPQGDVLLKLADLAESEVRKVTNSVTKTHLLILAQRFRALFAEHLVSSAPSKLTTMPAVEDQVDRGYLAMKIEGEEGLRVASRFLTLIPALNSKDPSIRKKAFAIADKLISAVDKMATDYRAYEAVDRARAHIARKRQREAEERNRKTTKAV